LFFLFEGLERYCPESCDEERDCDGAEKRSKRNLHHIGSFAKEARGRKQGESSQTIKKKKEEFPF
jgi:hypothetical protein